MRAESYSRPLSTPIYWRRRCAGLGGADGSIVSDGTGANTNAPAIPIGQMAADLIAAR
nr:hypothetical protein JVH1_6865 [Rhodococcus sp. JVH1]